MDGRYCNINSHSTINERYVYASFYNAKTKRIYFFIHYIVFGVSLRKLLDTENREIPLVIERCIDNLRERAMQTEGLFRIPGDTILIQELKTLFDTEKGQDVNFAKYTVHDIAGLVKLYFRELPNPLFPFAFFPKLLELYSFHESSGEIDDSNTYIDQIAKMIASLPSQNLVLFKYLLQFLADVALGVEANKMTPRNLAVVFAPNIIRPKEDTIETALLSPQVSKILETMIENNNLKLWDKVQEYINNGETFQLENDKNTSTPKIRLVVEDSPLVKKKKREKLKGAIKRKSAKEDEYLSTQEDVKNKKRLSNSLGPALVTPFTMDDLVKVNRDSRSSSGPASARSASPRK